MPIPAFLITPLIYAVLAAVAVATIGGWFALRDHRIRVEERDKARAALQKCVDNTAVAVAANASLKASSDKLVAQIADQNSRIDSIGKQEEAARKAKDAALAVALARERQLRGEVVRLTVIANSTEAVPKENACEEARAILRDVAADVVR